jgi:transcriptional regulator with XRE-family HTH domain
MKRVDTIARVRRAFHIQGWSMKKIARDLHVSRNTVRKILRSGETDFTYERERQPMPRIGPWQAQLEPFLSANAGKPSRERLTLIRIFEVEGRSATGPRNAPTARARIRGRL